MTGPLKRVEAAKCTTPRAAWYSYRDAIGLGGDGRDELNRAMESAFLAGVAWGYARQKAEIEKHHAAIVERMNQLHPDSATGDSRG